MGSAGRRVRPSSPGAHRGAIEEIPCDVAISAIGTNANPFAAKIGGKMELNKWGYIVADEENRPDHRSPHLGRRRHRHRCRYGHSGEWAPAEGPLPPSPGLLGE